MRQSKYFVSSSSCLVTKLEICCQNSSLIKLLNHSILLFLIFLVMCLRGMLHVGEVKFTLGWNFNLGWIFFWDTGTFHLRSKTENFHPKVKWIFWPFCMIFYMFSFYKNTDILISYNWQKMSDKWYYKL